MRGKGSVDFPCSIHDGITPAYAGKSFHELRFFHTVKDHPRLCGEKHHLHQIRENLPGSPPPMRGKGKFNVIGNHIARITPAYAGKSSPVPLCLVLV